MKRPHCLLWLLCSLQLATGQTLDSLPLLTIDSVQSFAVDPLQHLLVEHTDGSLQKYSPQGTMQFHFHNTVLGDLTNIDASDPFNILLFFAEQQTVVQLDRTLGETALLDLRTTSIVNATAIARNFDNNLWVFDDFNSRLYLLNPLGEVLKESNDFRINEKVTEAATHIWREGDALYVNFPDHGLAVFDLNVQLQQWWPVVKVQNAYFHKGKFCFQVDTTTNYQALPILRIDTPTALSFPLDYSVLRQSFDQYYFLVGERLLVFREEE